jgi:hypothetical protein
MPCLMVLLALVFPRLAIALLWLFTTFLDRAFHNSLILLILGFLFLPLTSLVYAFIFNGGHSVEGIYLVAIVIAALADLGLLGTGHRSRRLRD